jgi:hypothetical protein
LQNSPLDSSCVAVALIENYSTSKTLKVSPKKNHTFWVVTLLSQMSDMSIYVPHSTGSLYDTITITILFTRAGKLVWKFDVTSRVPLTV